MAVFLMRWALAAIPALGVLMVAGVFLWAP
jgi:hypothetical protein